MALIIQIKRISSSSHCKWVLDKSDQLKCDLKSPDEKNVVNNEPIKNFASVLRIMQKDIEIIAGPRLRKKTIKIKRAIDMQAVLKILNLASGKQQKIIF